MSLHGRISPKRRMTYTRLLRAVMAAPHGYELHQADERICSGHPCARRLLT